MKKYKLNNLIEELLAGLLNERQRDIVKGRFGLSSKSPQTLAAIGDKYGITRERVRQIESLALASIKLQLNKGTCKEIVKLVKDNLKNVGGVRKDKDLYNDLHCYFSDVVNNEQYGRQISFIINSSEKFKYHPEDNDFYGFWYANGGAVDKLFKFTEKMTSALEMGGAKPKLAFADNFLSVSKKFATSPYEDFGLSHWSHICPKVSRDWAYLVLKKEGGPLHFTELTKAINKLRKEKVTNAQTVHNELIKDNRFMLVGRGTYGLKEFGILPGTARDVIVHVLKKNGPQKSKDAIQLVLKERAFKENTLLLNLQDRKYFKRLDDGRYTVREV